MRTRSSARYTRPRPPPAPARSAQAGGACQRRAGGTGERRAGLCPEPGSRPPQQLGSSHCPSGAAVTSLRRVARFTTIRRARSGWHHTSGVEGANSQACFCATTRIRVTMRRLLPGSGRSHFRPFLQRPSRRSHSAVTYCSGRRFLAQNIGCGSQRCQSPQTGDLLAPATSRCCHRPAGIPPQLVASYQLGAHLDRLDGAGGA
jgi:hypothetical protein